MIARRTTPSQAARRIGCLMLLAAAPLAADDLQQARIWESTDGQTITARVLELQADSASVRMRRSDGLVFTLGFDQFAAHDAQRLQQAAAELRRSAQTTDDAPQQEPPETATAPLPKRFELKKVPMVVQKGNFCVPASAAMIAGFHSIDTDQDQIAFLASAQSIGNQGTNPQDMLLAMQKLGFKGQSVYWKNADAFQQHVLPRIREALVRQGPIYVSFKPGVFGDSGHGCVIIGYHDRKEQLSFHNPWGSVFEKDYADVATQARGIVLIEAPAAAPIAGEAYVEKIRRMIPTFKLPITELPQILSKNNQPHKLVWCSRRDARDDKRFAVDTARDDGRKILDLAFHRNPAVLIPRSQRNGEVSAYLFVTRPPKGGGSFMVREITADGWSEPELATLGSLTRYWPTRIESPHTDKVIWELPMIELHPDD